MNDECLTLTTYFGERDRTPGGLLADELLDVYGAHGLAASVLLRGAAGFGRLGHLNTDRLLSLSEDLPVISIAVDTRERIESMLEDVLAIKRRGLVTLERARLLTGELGGVALPAQFAGVALPAQFAGVALPAQFAEGAKLTVFVGRRERVLGKPAAAAVCDLLHQRGVAGATVLLGVDGTTAGRRVRARFFGANAEVPMIVVAVGSGDRIADVLPELGRLLDRPLLTLERVQVCKRDGELLATPNELPATDEHGLAIWRKLTVYCSQGDTHDGRPLHLEIIRRLRAADAAGATSVRGVWGFHGDHRPHGDRLLQLRRRVPVVTIAIDDPQRSARSFEIIDALTAERGLVTSEMVPAAQAMGERGHTGGVRLAKL